MQVRKITVLGAGIMGAGIAQLAAQAGLAVTLQDISAGALQGGLRRAACNLALQVEVSWIEAEEAEEVLERIATSEDPASAVGEADFIIEAVPENLDLKREVFGIIGREAPPHAVLASNTSTYNIMAEVETAIAPRTLITHFFNPAQLIPLVEVVRGEATEQAAVDTAVDLMRTLGKVPIVINKYLPGFVVNRFQLVFNGMAYALLAEGVLEPEEIDRAIEASIGLRLAANGPFATMDMGGLDTAAASARTMGIEPPAILQYKVSCGELGVKTGKGFYDYCGLCEDDILARRDRRLMRLLEAWPRSD